MRILLDTHSFLWFISGDKRISTEARDLIADLGNQVLLSVGSLWEIAIKVSLGKLILLKPFDQLIPEQIALNDIEILQVSLDDLGVVAELPYHHRDPFDRMIVSQAMTRSIPLLSSDATLVHYPIQRVW
jgi:PIN domain nuclease of toxin-antitoxin system